MQEQNYYPFGLAINEGQAAGEPDKYLYQTKKMQDELGLNLYDFHARQYDAQIGRFWGIDPMDQFPSGYTGLGNDPANMIDPSGMATGTHWFPQPLDGPPPPPNQPHKGEYFADDDPAALLASAQEWLDFLAKSSGLNFVTMQGTSVTGDNIGGGSSTFTGGSSGGPSQSAASMGAWSTANTGTSTNINMPTSENAANNLNSGGDGSGGSNSEGGGGNDNTAIDPRKGGVIKNDKDFYTFMIDAANGAINSKGIIVEVSAWHVNTNDIGVWIINPWFNNQVNGNTSNANFVKNYGYDPGDIDAQGHTHPSSGPPSSTDDAFSRDHGNMPIYIFGANGNVSYFQHNITPYTQPIDVTPSFKN
jgi:RHS repeat-associated protein